VSLADKNVKILLVVSDEERSTWCKFILTERGLTRNLRSVATGEETTDHGRRSAEYGLLDGSVDWINTASFP